MLSAASGTASSSTPGLNRIGISPKLSTGSDKIQGSIERLTVKWEAKRKNLVSGAGGEESVAMASLSNGASKLGQRSAATSDLGGHNRRAAIMEQRLQSIKQQGISTLKVQGPAPSSTRTMMAAPSTSKRLSISDQVGLGRRVMMPRQPLKTVGHSSDASVLAFSPSSGSDEDEERHAKSSSDELDMGSRNSRSSDEELPPYPAVGLAQTPALRPRLPMPPPPAPEVATAMEDMVTYVPPVGPHPSPPTSDSTSAASTAVMYPSSTSSSLIVKPITLSTSPPSSSSVLAQRPSPESAKGFPRHRRPLAAAGQQSRLLPPRSLPHVPRQSVQQQSQLQHSPPTPPSPAPSASPTDPAPSSIARPKQYLAQSGRGQQHHFGIKSSYVQHYNRSPPTSSLQHPHHPPPPPPPPPPPLRHPPSTDNPSLSPQRRIDYPNGLSPPPPPPPTVGNGDGGRGRSSGGLMVRGGGDNADSGNNEGSALAFARRLPSPRYRQQQQQPLPRRPLSHQEQQWQHRQRARPPLPNGGKSLSVENILDEGEASEGNPLSPDDPSLNGHLQYHPAFAHQARGMRNRDSISLQQVSKRTMSNGAPEGRGRSSSPQKLVNALEEMDGDRDYHSRSTSSGNQRRSSSGLRMMWQGAQQHQSQQRSGSRFSGQSGGQTSSSSSVPHLRLGRASSVESAASKLNEKSRSPSPGEGNLSPHHKSLVGGGGVPSRLRKPLSTSSLPSAHHRAQQQQGMYQQNQQRNSYGGDHFNRAHQQRAKSASNSPGASRTTSPPSNATGASAQQHQQQSQVPRRNVGQPPPPPRQGYSSQQVTPQRQQQARSGFGYPQQQHQHRSQPHLTSSSPSSPHHQANAISRPTSGGGGGSARNLYSYQQQHQTTSYQGRPSQMQQPNAASHLRVPNGGRTNGLVGGVGVGPAAAGRHSSVGLPMPGFASGNRSGQRTM